MLGAIPIKLGIFFYTKSPTINYDYIGATYLCFKHRLVQSLPKSIVAQSSTEAKYIFFISTAGKLWWEKSLLIEPGISCTKSPTISLIILVQHTYVQILVSILE